MAHDIGLIGLGTMGRNLALNLADHGYSVGVYNRTYAKTVSTEQESDRIHGFKDLPDMLASLSPNPKKLIVMLPAGKVVEQFLEQMESLLTEEDIVIDGGNSDFTETIRRSSSYRFQYVGCGISGGEHGARYGPSIMVGCKREVYSHIAGILEAVSSKHGDKPCCGWLGENGAGHFVKLVHNGIEYSEMQLLQEIFNIVTYGSTHGNESSVNGERLQFLRDILMEWNDGDLSGYLVEICIKILGHRTGSEHTINTILDKAEQKGTGKICLETALRMGVDVTAMADAVMARFLSHQKEKRMIISQSIWSNERGHFTILPDDLRKAFYLCKMVGYIQGFNLLLAAKEEYGWDYTLEQICGIWSNGCILRCKLLDHFKELAKHDPIEKSSYFLSVCRDGMPALKRTCHYSINCNVYAPVFHSCLMWVNGLLMGEGNGTLIQAMRDYFGRHGVVLKSGVQTNISWDE